ncbi:hypothetical protein ACFL5L_02200, partial [candidate division KSB1 bacterium]
GLLASGPLYVKQEPNGHRGISLLKYTLRMPAYRVVNAMSLCRPALSADVWNLAKGMPLPHGMAFAIGMGCGKIRISGSAGNS